MDIDHPFSILLLKLLIIILVHFKDFISFQKVGLFIIIRFRKHLLEGLLFVMFFLIRLLICSVTGLLFKTIPLK